MFQLDAVGTACLQEGESGDMTSDQAGVTLDLHVLGAFAVRHQGKPLALPPSQKTRALLAYLAVIDQPQRREQLCGMFWDAPDDLRGALRWSLSKIRQIVNIGGTMCWPPIATRSRS